MVHKIRRNSESQLLKDYACIDYVMTQTTYNNANAEERSKQLRNAKVEEAQIQELSRKPFENLPQPVQEKLNSSG